ncbi:MAG TPA: PadR family transcriptional regulator [Kofleriaceae bacterium]|nr:PadR family transcriptional regulator [Kofleriaceae bacterium]
MSSSTRLLVLGVVRTFQPIHGYEVRRELHTWRAEEWASVGPGSIYNALKSLTREGLLEVVGTKQVGGRPERTIYKITRAGDELLRTMLDEAWWEVRPLVDPLLAALSLLTLLPRDRVLAALEHRATVVRAMANQLDYFAASHDSSENPDHVQEMMRLMRARLEAELPWAEAFAKRLRAGELTTASDPPWQPGGGPRSGRRARTRTKRA